MFEKAVILALLISVIHLSTSGIIGSLGGLLSETCGVMNLCAQGLMCFGAFFAMLGSYYSGNAWIGLLCGILAGGVAGAVNAMCTVEFGANQSLYGIGLNTFAAGLTAYFMRIIFGTSRSASVASLGKSPIFENIPVIGPVLSGFSPITYIGFFIVAIIYILMYHTSIGVRIRAVGNKPEAVETAGINVWRLRTLFLILAGMLVAMAGAFLSIGQMSVYTDDMVAGKGMLAFVAVKIGRYRPFRILLVALAFGFFEALQMRLQLQPNISIPTELIQTIPYVAAIIIMFFNKSTNAPSSIGTPYLKRKYNISED